MLMPSTRQRTVCVRLDALGFVGMASLTCTNQGAAGAKVKAAHLYWEVLSTA